MAGPIHTTLVGISYSKEYLGEGNIHQRTIRETDIELIFDCGTPGSSPLTSPSLSAYKAYIAGLQSIGDYGNFSIGSLTFTNSRVTSASFPASEAFTERQVDLGKATIKVESLYDGDSTTIGGTYYSGIIGSGLTNANIKDVSINIKKSNDDYSFQVQHH